MGTEDWHRGLAPRSGTEEYGRIVRHSEASSRCEVWYATLDDLAAGDDALLDEVELDRRTAYYRQADADRFTLGRVLTRLVVGRALSMPPAAVRLDSTCPRCGAPHGKPRALDTGAPELSISHSGDLVVVAASTAGKVGVDIEHCASRVEEMGGDDDTARDDDMAREDELERTGMDAADLAAQVLTPVEHQHLQTLFPASRPAALLRYWTRKEAVLKATGYGLTLDPATVEVSAPDQPARVVSWPRVCGDRTAFTLVDLDIQPGYLATVAIQAPEPVEVDLDDARSLLYPARALPAETGPASSLG